jgi:HD-GYP domain-containing protein (c-di-GMP phosphodiesterase class II)
LKEGYEFEEHLKIKSKGLRKNIDEFKSLSERPKIIEKPGTVYTPHHSLEELCYEGPKISERMYSQAPHAFQCTGNIFKEIKRSVIDSMAKVNTELWIILSLLTLTTAINYLVSAHRLVLGLYTLPTLFSAYFYGRRHAILTAFTSVFMVGLLARFNPNLFAEFQKTQFLEGRWYDITAWGGILVVTAYAMGTLHEYNKSRLRELRQTYHGLLLILRQFISKDKYTENHSYRVSVYATKIASYLGLKHERIEDIRAASLLHDIGKLDISRELLYKAASLTKEEFNEMKKHMDKSGDILEPVGGPLSRIIPIILAHHDKYDGSGYRPLSGEEIPLESRIISVADVYDSLTSNRPYRKAMSPFDAKEIIVKGSGKDFDPKVVRAFVTAFGKREMEVPDVVL